MNTEVYLDITIELYLNTTGRGERGREREREREREVERIREKLSELEMQ